MPNVISSILSRMGLYSPIRRLVRFTRDPIYRKNQIDIYRDLRQTSKQLEHWDIDGCKSETGEKRFAILSFSNLPLHTKFHGIMAQTMRMYGYKPVVFTYRGCRAGQRYLKLFGIDDISVWEDLVEANQHLAPEIDTIAQTLLSQCQNLSDVLNCQFHGVDVGRHALSVTARRRFQGRLDINDPETRQLLENLFKEAIRSTLIAEKFLDQYPVQVMLVRDAGYIPNGALYETALLRGVDCVVYEQGQRRGTWIFKRYTPETKGLHYFSLAPSTWKNIQNEPWTATQDAKLQAVFEGRYKPDSTDDTRRLMTGKRLKTPQEVYEQLGIDPNKKTAVIFSHIAWDAAFFFGSCLFDDFENWLFETVKFAARECPEINWLVKLHPFNAFKLEREGRIEESEMVLLRSLMPLPDHVKIVRSTTDISTQSLFRIVNYVLTVNGTVGMEFPCFGVPAILAGTGRYNGYGFTVEPPTREAYFETLKTLHRMPPLDEQTQRLARQHFYTLTARRQTSLEDIAPMELRRANEAQSDVHDNISIAARSLQEFREMPSIIRLGQWLADSTEPDIVEPEN